MASGFKYMRTTVVFSRMATSCGSSREDTSGYIVTLVHAKPQQAVRIMLITVKLRLTADATASVSRFTILKTKDTSSIRMWYGLKACASNGSTATRASAMPTQAVRTKHQSARIPVAETLDAMANALKFTRPKTLITTKSVGLLHRRPIETSNFFRYFLFITIVVVGRVRTYWHNFVFDAC